MATNSAQQTKIIKTTITVEFIKYFSILTPVSLSCASFPIPLGLIQRYLEINAFRVKSQSSMGSINWKSAVHQILLGADVFRYFSTHVRFDYIDKSLRSYQSRYSNSYANLLSCSLCMRLLTSNAKKKHLAVLLWTYHELQQSWLKKKKKDIFEAFILLFWMVFKVLPGRLEVLCNRNRTVVA